MEVGVLYWGRDTDDVFASVLELIWQLEMQV